MHDKIERIKQEFFTDIKEIKNLDDMEKLRVKYLARKGVVSELFEALREVAAEEKPKIGKLLNELRSSAQTEFDRLKAEIEKALKPKEIVFDITLPGRPKPIGTKHPVTQSMDEFKRIFVGMGFSTVTGPEIESDYYNFEALNFPEDHPARDMQDTFFIHGTKILLRTHTTPVQIRIMEKQPPPVRAIMPGRVYRNEAVSPRSLVLFHQVDGIYVDRGVTFSELKGTLVSFARQYYGSGIKYRFRPSFFPFVEPGAEMDIHCYICGGKGCRVCKYSGWLEIVGSGMVHPHVLKRVGYDPDEVSGFAFGFGVERPFMLKYDIDDIRLLYENDVRFLKQF
ncbi:MAG TPA: phenylalanine--tRNA ligase subunit alpha [Bacteroidota bacterium]|nr:phenylalanine--tRNA ligase subunit alpha [Bacteroidota bacterium]